MRMPILMLLLMPMLLLVVWKDTDRLFKLNDLEGADNKPPPISKAEKNARVFTLLLSLLGCAFFALRISFFRFTNVSLSLSLYMLGICVHAIINLDCVCVCVLRFLGVALPRVSRYVAGFAALLFYAHHVENACDYLDNGHTVRGSAACACICGAPGVNAYTSTWRVGYTSERKRVSLCFSLFLSGASFSLNLKTLLRLALLTFI